MLMTLVNLNPIQEPLEERKIKDLKRPPPPLHAARPPNIFKDPPPLDYNHFDGGRAPQIIKPLPGARTSKKDFKSEQCCPKMTNFDAFGLLQF